MVVEVMICVHNLGSWYEHILGIGPYIYLKNRRRKCSGPENELTLHTRVIFEQCKMKMSVCVQGH